MGANKKRNHFLAVMLLKRFSDSTDELIWVYDRENDSYNKQGVINTAVIGNYYRYFGKDGAYHDDLEDFFADIEGEAKSPIDELSASKPLSNLEKEKLAVYVAYQKLRVPDFSNKMQALSDKLFKSVTKKFIFNKEQASNLINRYNKSKGESIKLDPEVLLKTIQNEEYKMVQSREFEVEIMLKSGLDLVNYFLLMDWKVIFAPKEGAFITSDNPFVLFPPAEHNPYRGVGVATRGAVKVLPLSNKFYLAMFDEGDKLEFYKTNREHCRQINDTVALNCDRFVYSHSKELLESVVNRTKLKDRKEKEHVEIG